MSETNQSQDVFVGYVNQPQTSINFSLTEQDLNDLRKYLVPNSKDPNKPSRVWCTFKSGVSKAGKSYNFISVYDKSAKQDESHRRVVVAETVDSDDLPF